jgi:hypothetical protein
LNPSFSSNPPLYLGFRIGADPFFPGSFFSFAGTRLSSLAKLTSLKAEYAGIVHDDVEVALI